MRREKKAIVLLLAGLVSGCDYDPVETERPVQRDVYSRVEDCMADWGDPNLCQKVAEAQAQAQVAGGVHGGGAVVIQPYYFYGPEYLPGSRYAYFGGNQYVPRAQTSLARTAPVPPSTSYVQSRNQMASKINSGVAQPGSRKLSGDRIVGGGQSSSSSSSSSSGSSRGGFGGAGRSAGSSSMGS